MYNFCTLFDTAYLSRGVALYKSLVETGIDFHLYIFSFDDNCYNVLEKLNFPEVTLISLREFENADLLNVKHTRSKGEYCWTCTPSSILYVLDKYNVGNCTYIDADLCFFSSPEVLLNELKDKSILITEHKFSKRYENNIKYGKYCVQFISFNNDENGRKALRWWEKACISWCYSRWEDGKFGDQKYLDDWIQRFNGVRELKHMGGGVAPWNIQQYAFCKEGEKYSMFERKTGKSFKLIFYHFHGLKFYIDGKVDLAGYRLSDDILFILYLPYLKKLERMKKSIANIDNSIDPHGSIQFPYLDINHVARYFKRRMMGNVKDKSYYVGE